MTGSALAARWVPVAIHSRQGAISATLAFEKDLDQDAYPPYRNMALTVFRAGKAVFTERLCARGSCQPSVPGALDVRNVWGGKPAEVLVELNTGGAHCCYETKVVVFVAGAWRSIAHDWGNPGYRGQSHGAAYWFISGDDRFAYSYTDYAHSLLPLSVWRINGGGRLVEVTRERLDLVAADAKTLWKLYLEVRARKGTDVRGVLGAWCADQYLLGAAGRCDSALQAALKAGLLRVGGLGPMDAAYIKKLKRDLVAWGYAK